MTTRMLLPFLLLTASCATAQTWRGKIVDCKTTAPIEGVDVEITVAPGDASLSGSTGSDGAFAFASATATKQSTASLTATKRGYQATQASLGASPGAAQPVCMQPTH